MNKRKEKCPYTKSGKWPDKKLTKIIESALKKPNEKCTYCGGDTKIGGSGEVAWCKCSKCGKLLGTYIN